MSTAIANAIETGVLGERVWFYANYHCNLGPKAVSFSLRWECLRRGSTVLLRPE